MTRRQQQLAAPRETSVLHLMAPDQPITAHELRAVLADPGLTFAAKGVLALVLSRPAGAVIGVGELFATTSDPMPVIEQAVNELEHIGLLTTAEPGRSAGTATGGVMFGRGRRARRKGGG